MSSDSAQVSHKVILAWVDNKIVPKAKSNRVLIRPNIHKEIPWDFFYGVFQGIPCVCGSRVVLFLDSSHYFHLKYVVDEETNNRVGLYAL